MNLLSSPSKMPCLGFNIPAFKYCPAAQLMARVKDKAKKFICDACYACKGFYMFPNTKKSLQDKANFLTKSLREDKGESFINEISQQITKRYFDKQNVWRERCSNKELTFLHLGYFIYVFASATFANAFI